MKLVVVIGIALFLLNGGSASADCGSIPYEEDADIFEPNQNALICWNGTEEILVLSTNLRASKPTKVLEVIPLPGKPTVTKASQSLFTKAIDLLNKKLRQMGIRGRRRGGGLFGDDDDDGGGEREPPAGKLTFHKKIGATDVSVVQVKRIDGFVTWVQDHLKRAGVGAPKIPQPLQDVVKEYLADGYEWFVFNVVSVGRATRTKQALQYRFKSKHLYYPMRITRTEKGHTTVSLLILTPKLLRKQDFVGLPHTDVNLAHPPVTLKVGELRRLHRAAYRMLRHPSRTRLRIWEISGPLSGFKKDLLVRAKPAKPKPRR